MPPLDGPFREALVQIPERVCVASLEVFVNRVVALAAPIADHRDRPAPHALGGRQGFPQLEPRGRNDGRVLQDSAAVGRDVGSVLHLLGACCRWKDEAERQKTQGEASLGGGHLRSSWVPVSVI